VQDFHALLAEPAELDDVRHLSAPTLLLQGGGTKLPSRCIVHRLRGALRNATWRVVQGAGHMLPMTHRDQVNALVAQHIDANASAMTALREAA
jgi:pimeloyl-ACP methyl ester carboxylesterase